MRKFFLLSSLTVALAFSQLNCAKTATDNSNLTNINAATAQPTPTATTNANIAVASTPLPTFTNADEALAEGKRLLDALETDKAIDALSQAVKLNPDLADAHFNLGIAYALVEKDEQDKELTEVEVAPTPKTSRNTKKKKNTPPVRTKNSEKAFENAVKTYKKILAKNSKDDAAQFNLGRALNKLNEDEDSMKALREAVKLKPDDAEYQIEYGKILIKLAQYDEAVAALKKAVSLEESNLEANDLLEKAEAGKSRVDYGNKPKPPQEAEQTRKHASKKTGNADDTDDADDLPVTSKSPSSGEKKPFEKKPAEKKPAEKKPAETKPAEKKNSEKKPTKS